MFKKTKRNITRWLKEAIAQTTEPIIQDSCSSTEQNLKNYISEQLKLNNIVTDFLSRYNSNQQDISCPQHFVSYFYDTYGNITNLGDYIQTIATEQAILRCVPEKSSSFVSVQRNRLVEHYGGTCVMQGWYEYESLNFLPGRNTRPVWIGTHFDSTIQKALALLFQYSSIRFNDVGCRDKETLAFCRQYGISSYFSRCLTLTLPKREENAQADKIYIVDCSDEIISFLPEYVKKNARILAQRGFHREPWQSWDKCRSAAEDLLEEYKTKARLVITTALHCAQPCIAMGIPVVFIDPGYDEMNRFSSMDGIIRQYTINELKNGLVDFNPDVLDIEPLKEALLTNLRLTLKMSLTSEEQSEIADARNFISTFNILDK